MTCGGPVGPISSPLRPAAPFAAHASVTVLICHCEFRRVATPGATYPGFPLDLTRFFVGKQCYQALNSIFGDEDAGFSGFL